MAQVIFIDWINSDSGKSDFLHYINEMIRLLSDLTLSKDSNEKKLEVALIKKITQTQGLENENLLSAVEHFGVMRRNREWIKVLKKVLGTVKGVPQTLL